MIANSPFLSHTQFLFSRSFLSFSRSITVPVLSPLFRSPFDILSDSFLAIDADDDDVFVSVCVCVCYLIA